MKRLMAVAVLALIAPIMALAQNTDQQKADQQSADHPPRGLGYVFVGEGTHSMGLTTGFGGEAYVFKGLGLGAEIGAADMSSFVTGVGSADLSYHFFPKKVHGRVSPFITGGYTAFFGHNTHTGTGLFGHKPLMTEGFNIGGGVDLFASKHVGMRFDVRYYGHGGRILNYIYPDLDQFSFVAFRIGVTFR